MFNILHLIRYLYICINVYHNVSAIECISTNISQLYSNMIGNMGSGWQFNRVLYFDIHIDKYSPLKGSSYISLPEKLASKKAIVNVKNNDNECFKWSVTAAIILLKSTQNVLLRGWSSTL